MLNGMEPSKPQSTLASMLIQHRLSAGGSALNLIAGAVEEYRQVLIKRFWQRLPNAAAVLVNAQADRQLVKFDLREGNDAIEVGLLCSQDDFTSFVLHWTGDSIQVAGGGNSAEVFVCMIHMKAPNAPDVHIRKAAHFQFKRNEWRQRLQHLTSLEAAIEAGFIEDRIDRSKGFVMTLSATPRGLVVTECEKRSIESVVLLLERMDALLNEFTFVSEAIGQCRRAFNTTCAEERSYSQRKPRKQDAAEKILGSKFATGDDGVASQSSLRDVVTDILPKRFLGWIDWMEGCQETNAADSGHVFSQQARQFRKAQANEAWFFAALSDECSSFFSINNPAFAELVQSAAAALASLPPPGGANADEIRDAATGFIGWAQGLGLKDIAEPTWL